MTPEGFIHVDKKGGEHLLQRMSISHLKKVVPHVSLETADIYEYVLKKKNEVWHQAKKKGNDPQLAMEKLELELEEELDNIISSFFTNLFEDQ